MPWGGRNEAPFFRANNPFVYCTPVRIDNAIANRGRKRNGLNYNAIRLILEQIVTLGPQYVGDLPPEYVRDVMPSKRKGVGD